MNLSVLETKKISSYGVLAMINILNNAIYQLVQLESRTDRVLIIDIEEESDKAVIKIKDSGGGIAPMAKNRLFEPYFTTKHQSIGTGIGLYMSYEIIVKHFEGSIAAENRQFDYKGKKFTGAEFTIKLPLQQEFQKGD